MRGLGGDRTQAFCHNALGHVRHGGVAAEWYGVCGVRHSQRPV